MLIQKNKQIRTSKHHRTQLHYNTFVPIDLFPPLRILTFKSPKENKSSAYFYISIKKMREGLIRSIFIAHRASHRAASGHPLNFTARFN